MCAGSHSGGGNGAFWERLGWEVVGPLALRFSQWLGEQLESAPSESPAYFLSREGGFLKRCFEACYEGQNMRPLRDLYTSRRVVGMAAFEKADEEGLRFLISGKGRAPVGAFLERVGLDPEAYPSEIRQAHFRSARDEILPHRDLRLPALFRALERPLQRQAANERQRYLAYLQAQGVLEQEHLLLVDIGWHGSLQRYFDRLLRRERPDLKLDGYYLATLEPFSPPHENCHAHGCFVGDGEPRQRLIVFKHCLELVEFCFTSPQPTVVGFTAEGKPVFDQAHENPHLLEALQTLQDAAVAFIEAHRENRLTAQAAFRPLTRLLTHPTEAEVHQLGGILHEDGIGTSARKRRIVPPKPTPTLLQPAALSTRYRNSYWRAGFYAQLNLAERRLLNLLVPHTRTRRHPAAPKR